MCSYNARQPPSLSLPLPTTIIRAYGIGLARLSIREANHLRTIYILDSVFLAAEPWSVEAEALSIETLTEWEAIVDVYETWVEKYRWTVGPWGIWVLELAGMRLNDGQRAWIRRWLVFYYWRNRVEGERARRDADQVRAYLVECVRRRERRGVGLGG